MTRKQTDPADPGDIFAAARRPTFKTPLAHWALTWPEGPWLPKRARPIVSNATAAALRKQVTVPGGFSLSPRLTWTRTTRSVEAAQRNLWPRLSANVRDPQEWLELLAHFENPTALRMHLVSARELTFVMLMTRDTAPLAYASRNVDLDRAVAHHCYLAVARGQTGAGVGAQVLANAIAFYPSVGVTRIELLAGLTAGGSVWPKFGFRPIDAKQWARVQRTIAVNAARLPPAVRDAYAGGRAAFDLALRAVLDDPRPDAIRMVHRLDNGQVAANAGGLPRTVGDWLLQGSRWRGVLDLLDAQSERIAREYIGRRIKDGVVSRPPNW